MKLLFLHGLGQDAQSWEHTIKHLEYNDVVCPDIIPKDTDSITFRSLADALEAKMNNDSEPVVICGLSLGAVLAIELYLRKPDVVSELILIAPQYKVPTKMIDLQNIIFRLMPKKAFSEANVTKNNMISISASMRLLDYSDRLKDVTCPVCIVCGENDRANKKAAINMSRALPDSRLEMVQMAGHEVNLDAPRELANIIKTSLNK